MFRARRLDDTAGRIEGGFYSHFAGVEQDGVLGGPHGRVLAPGAQAKLYVTASPEIRAERRWKQLADAALAYEEVLADIRTRDARDAGREDSPMRPADDAVLLDTSEMTIEAAFDAARRIVEAARGS